MVILQPTSALEEFKKLDETDELPVKNLAATEFGAPKANQTAPKTASLGGRGDNMREGGDEDTDGKGGKGSKGGKGGRDIKGHNNNSYLQ